jgi:hypothetical protein
VSVVDGSRRTPVLPTCFSLICAPSLITDTSASAWPAAPERKVPHQPIDDHACCGRGIVVAALLRHSDELGRGPARLLPDVVEVGPGRRRPHVANPPLRPNRVQPSAHHDVLAPSSDITWRLRRIGLRATRPSHRHRPRAGCVTPKFGSAPGPPAAPNDHHHWDHPHQPRNSSITLSAPAASATGHSLTRTLVVIDGSAALGAG